MIAFARPLEQEIAPGIRIQLCEISDLPPEVQAALPELLHQLESHIDAADQQRAIQTANVHRDDVRLNAALLVLGVGVMAAVLAVYAGWLWRVYG